MVDVEDRNEDVAEEAPNAATPVPAPSVEDGGVIFVLDKASLKATKVGKILVRMENMKALVCKDYVLLFEARRPSIDCTYVKDVKGVKKEKAFLGVAPSMSNRPEKAMHM